MAYTNPSLNMLLGNSLGGTEVSASFKGAFGLSDDGGKWNRQAMMGVDYYVIAYDLTTDPASIADTPGIPRLWQNYNGLICNKVDPSEQQNVMHPRRPGVQTSLWVVSTQFSSRPDPSKEDYDYSKGKLNPTEKPADYSWQTEHETYQLHNDAVYEYWPPETEPDPFPNFPRNWYEGLAKIQTAADEPRPLDSSQGWPIVNISRYECYPFDPDLIYRYVNRTNVTTFMGAPSGCALMHAITSVDEMVESVKYIRVTYTIKFRMRRNDDDSDWLIDQWRFPLPNYGSIRYDDQDEGTRTQHRILDSEQQPVEGWLNPYGQEIPGAPTDQQQILWFYQYGFVDFDPLKLQPDEQYTHTCNGNGSS